MAKPNLVSVDARSRSPHKPKSAPKAKPTPHGPISSDPTFLYTPYPTHGIPDWGWDNVTTPISQTNTGYDATAPAIRGSRRAAALNATNAILTDGVGAGSFNMRIFVTNVAIDTALSGSTAQSQLTRDFYPRNFVQPSFTITGASLDQNDYALLCEFIHSAQHLAVSNGYQNVTQLLVQGRSTTPGQSHGIDATRTSGLSVKITQPRQLMPQRQSDPSNVADGTYVNQILPGARQQMSAKGYVTAMQRSHQRFQTPVFWQFSFTVAAMLSGIYTDAIVKTDPQKTWIDMLNDAKQQGVITGTPSLNKLNQRALSYAGHNATLLFPKLPTNPNSGTGAPVNVSGSGAAVVAAAQSALGYTGGYAETRPYPSSLADLKTQSSDCSGFATLCYKQAGAPDPNNMGYDGQGNTTSLQAHGKPTNSPQPGDLVFWNGPAHVAVYIGNGQCIELGSDPGPIQISVTAEDSFHTSFVGYRTYF